MPVKTERQHAGEFIASEGPGTLSREVGVIASGQSAAETRDGRVLKHNGAGKLVVATGSQGSPGVSNEDIAGVLVGDVDASAGDMPCVYIARIAEVKRANVKLHSVTGGGAASATQAVEDALEAKHIVLR